MTKLFHPVGAIALLATLAVFAGDVRAQSGGTLDLRSAIEIGLKSNPAAGSAQASEKQAAANFEFARSSRMPTAYISESFTNGNNPVFAFGSLLEQGRFTQGNFDLGALNNPSPLSNFRFGAMLKYAVFDQKQASSRITLADIGKRQAASRSDQVAQRIRFDVIRAYYDLLLMQAREEAAADAVRLAEADVKSSRDRVEVGTAVRSDLLSAEVQLAEFQQQLIEAQGENKTAQAALNLAMGTPLTTGWKLTGQLSARVFQVPDESALISQAEAQRPDLSVAAYSSLSAEQKKRAVRNEWLPRLDVFANAGVSRNDFLHGSSDYTIGASITFNLVDGGRRARVKAAEAEESIARSDRESLANQIRFEVIRYLQEYRSATQRLGVAERIISSAAESLRIIKDRYNAGLTTITEVIRAETALVRSKRNLITVRRDQYVAFGALLLASGGLNDLAPFTP